MFFFFAQSEVSILNRCPASFPKKYPSLQVLRLREVIQMLRNHGLAKISMSTIYYTLPETNSQSTWKLIVGRWVSFLGKAHFQGQTVSFRECNWQCFKASWKKTQGHQNRPLENTVDAHYQHAPWKNGCVFWVTIGWCWKTGWWLVYLSWTQKLLRHRCIKSRIVALVALISFPLLTPKEIFKNTHKTKTHNSFNLAFCVSIFTQGTFASSGVANRWLFARPRGSSPARWVVWPKPTPLEWRQMYSFFVSYEYEYTRKKRTRPDVLEGGLLFSFEVLRKFLDGWLLYWRDKMH